MLVIGGDVDVRRDETKVDTLDASGPVPPQNPVDRMIVDVYALGVELAYSCCVRRHFHDPCSQLRHPRKQS